MYKLRITNLANFPREVQYYQINKYVVLAPKKSIDIICEGSSAFSYYNSLQKKQFKVTILGTIEKPAEVKPVSPAEVIPEVKPVEEVVEETKEEVLPEEAPEAIEEAPVKEETEEKEEVAEEKSEEKPEPTIDDLSDRELKDILIKLGVSTSARARWKLIDLVNLNLPDDAKLSDYLQ